MTSALDTAKEAVVAAHPNLKPETATKPAAYVLAALGHPGYDRKFAETAILAMARRPELSSHDVVYGLRGR